MLVRVSDALSQVGMPKKWRLADLSDWAAQRGGLCLSEVYAGMSTRHIWQCAHGHVWQALPSSIRAGHWCAQCYGNSKRSTDELAALAASRGGALLDSGDKDSDGRHHWQCSGGHSWFALVSSVRRGSWCPKCAGSAPLTIEDAVAAARDQGGRCLSDVYVNARRPLAWECAAGHRWQATLGSIRSGKWCAICRREVAAQRLRLTLEDVQARAKAKGGRCVSEAYGGTAGTPLEFECSDGHRWWASPNTIQRSWCPHCAGKIVTLEEVQALAQSRGGKVISERYLGDGRALTWRCGLGHEWKAIPGSVKRGSWCPQCSAGLGERLTRVAFEAVFGAAFPSSFPAWLRPGGRVKWQLDGYCEPLALAFEHHGRYHYKVDGIYSKDETALRKRQQDDERKAALCKAHRVTLLVVPEVPSLVPVEKLVQFIVDAAKEARVPVPNQSAVPDWSKAYSTNDPLQAMQALATARGGLLLSAHYLGSSNPLTWRCSVGHEWKANPNSIQQGTWCPYCAGRRLTIADKELRLHEMHEEATRRGGQCLAQTYQNGNTRVGWVCAHGHEWQATPHNVLVNKSWCPTCHFDSRRRRASLR